MVTGKLFVLLVFVAATPLAYAKPESLWGQRVFPDDPEWPSPYRKMHVVVDSEKESKEKNNNVCETLECKKVAEDFLSSINKSVDPCEDFYEFTCGGWSTKNIPAYSGVWSRIMIFDDAIKRRIKNTLESPPKPSDILPVRQAKKWFRSCMDIESLEQRGFSTIESILMSNGGWPIIMDEEEWDSAEHSWQNVESYYAHMTGFYSLLHVAATHPTGRSKFGSISVLKPKLILWNEMPMSYRNYYDNDYNAYVRLVESVALLFIKHNHADVSKERLNKEAQEIVEFEKKIYELNSMKYDTEVVLFEDLAEVCANMTEANADPKAKINLGSLIQDLFDTVNIKVDPKTQVQIWNLNWVGKMSDLLARTPERTIVNYVHWTFVGKMLMYTTEQVRNELFAFVWQHMGVQERRPRWLECVTEMEMSHAAAYEFVEKYYTNTTEHAAVEMIKNIRTELAEKIDNSNWLDDESKKIAKDKVDSMKVFLGFPTWYNNRTAVINHYKGLTIVADYFDNVLSFMRYERRKVLKKYVSPKKLDEFFELNAITVYGLYRIDKNSLDLPAADFQTPLFSRHLPGAVSYGVTGVIIGHEMGHGFDNDGIQFSKEGTQTELSEQILRSYYQRVECFSDKYEEYFDKLKVVEMSPNRMANITMGENIADVTGIQAVFQAFEKLDEKSRDLRLPGLEEYTPEQLFFISFAATWCKVETPEFNRKMRKIIDSHSPAKIRVIGSVSNTKDFARVFNCPVGSSMNPTDKCNIWQKSEPDSEEKKSFMRNHEYLRGIQWKD